MTKCKFYIRILRASENVWYASFYKIENRKKVDENNCDSIMLNANNFLENKCVQL